MKGPFLYIFGINNSTDKPLISGIQHDSREVVSGNLVHFNPVILTDIPYKEWDRLYFLPVLPLRA